MRRPRPHRLTGSVGRLLAAAAITAAALALAMTGASRPVSAAGLDIGLNAGGLSLNLPSLPIPTPTPPSIPPAPSASPPGVPGNGSVPVVCPPTCPATTPGATPGNAGKAPSGSLTPRAAGVGGGPPPAFGSAAPGASSATSTISVPQSVGLSMTPPSPVEQLTPLAGISFGHAPYMWPLLVILDVLAAVGLVLLVRRTWSPTTDTA